MYECVNTIEFFFLGKYYVVDSGYPMMKGYLTPYKGISYHLQDFRRRGGSPRTRHEKFNHAHSSLRCTIERTFGVWKNKWRIIKNMLSFPFHIQILIVLLWLIIITYYMSVLKQLNFFFLGKYYVVDSGYPMMKIGRASCRERVLVAV